MNEIIKLILSLSLSGSLLAMILFAIKPFIRNRLSKSIQFYIWIVILLRFMLPFSFEESIMNNVFYGEQATAPTSSQNIALPTDQTSELENTSSISQSVQSNVTKGIYNKDADHSRYLIDLFHQYALYLWLLGAGIVFATNLTGYIRFAMYLKQANKPASDEQNRIFTNLLNRRNNVKLARNPFVTTPLLIGIFRPCIIIPDIEFSEIQLRNILLHELTHYKHFDIGVKWLLLLVTSVHWFNPLMYFIKKEVDCCCELACDEAVIKNLNNEGKQAYGDTLISVVAEYKYPIGALQATMCEEKKSLKERLLAIMNHSKKSRFIIILSVVLLGFSVFGALSLGAGVGMAKDAYISDKFDIGGYSLYLGADGVGKPTVVFEAARDQTSLYWSVVSAEVQKYTRSVVYARAGLGLSDKSPYNRTSEQKAIELHSLLKKAKIKPPYILVCSDFSVNNIRMFAARYPKEVAGIIMVDPVSENTIDICHSLMSEEEKKQWDTSFKQSFEETGLGWDGSYEDFMTSFQQVKAHSDSIKNIPVTAIIRVLDNPLNYADVEAQKQLAALSSKSKVVEVPITINEDTMYPTSGFLNSDIIIKEILEMVNQVKKQ